VQPMFRACLLFSLALVRPGPRPSLRRVILCDVRYVCMYVCVCVCVSVYVCMYACHPGRHLRLTSEQEHEGATCGALHRGEAPKTPL